MRKLLNHASLFSKIATVVVIGIVIVTASTLFLALQSTEQAYVETISIANQQVLDGVEAEMETANDIITRLILRMGSSTAFRGFLISDGENPVVYKYTYTMYGELKAIDPDMQYDAVAISADGQLSYASNDTNLSVSASELLKSEMVTKAKMQPHNIHYAFVDRGITNSSSLGRALVAFKAFTWPGTSNIYGYGFIVIPQTDLQSFYDKMSTPANTLLLLSPTGEVVSATDKKWEGRQDEILNLAVNKEENVQLARIPLKLDGRDVTIQYKTMPQWGLKLVTVLDQGAALKEMNGQAGIFFVCILTCVAILLTVFLFLRQITQPLHHLIESMHSATVDGLSEHVEVRGGSEARELAAAFNAMLDDINSYVAQLMELEQDKRKMELKTLQMQIKPHFIYNTLSSIKWLVWQKETDKAASCIDALTLLLRGVLSNQEEMVTAKDGLDSLKSYVFLQQIRYGDKVRYSDYLSANAAECLMPKLLLQPLVENAFFHAFSDRTSGGTIAVFVDRRGDKLLCEVIDNGVGMSLQQANAILTGKTKNESFKTSGIGVANVEQRIKLLFGEDYGVQIFSEPEKGTTVRISMPAIEKEID